MHSWPTQVLWKLTSQVDDGGFSSPHDDSTHQQRPEAVGKATANRWHHKDSHTPTCKPIKSISTVKTEKTTSFGFFNDKPSIIPGCPGFSTVFTDLPLVHSRKLPYREKHLHATFSLVQPSMWEIMQQCMLWWSSPINLKAL